MAREIPVLNQLLNILSQNRAQRLGEERFQQQMGMQQEQNEFQQENWLRRVGLEQQQLESTLANQELQRQLNSLLLADRSDPDKANQEMLRGIYGNLLPNVDPSLLEGGIPEFEGLESINALLGAQRLKPAAAQPTPTPTASELKYLNPLTMMREEFSNLGISELEKYKGQTDADGNPIDPFNAYSNVRLRELAPTFNALSAKYPNLGFGTLDFTVPPSTQKDVEDEGIDLAALAEQQRLDRERRAQGIRAGEEGAYLQGVGNLVEKTLGGAESLGERILNLFGPGRGAQQSDPLAQIIGGPRVNTATPNFQDILNQGQRR